MGCSLYSNVREIQYGAWTNQRQSAVERSFHKQERGGRGPQYRNKVSEDAVDGWRVPTTVAPMVAPVIGGENG